MTAPQRGPACDGSYNQAQDPQQSNASTGNESSFLPVRCHPPSLTALGDHSARLHHQEIKSLPQRDSGGMRLSRKRRPCGGKNSLIEPPEVAKSSRPDQIITSPFEPYLHSHVNRPASLAVELQVRFPVTNLPRVLTTKSDNFGPDAGLTDRRVAYEPKRAWTSGAFELRSQIAPDRPDWSTAICACSPSAVNLIRLPKVPLIAVTCRPQIVVTRPGLVSRACRTPGAYFSVGSPPQTCSK